MQLISKFIKGTKFLLCVVDIFRKYKDKKVITIFNAFQKILDKSTRKTNEIWVDKGTEFYNSSFKNG